MTAETISVEEQLTLQTLRHTTTQTGEWPVLDFLATELELHGVADPEGCLQDMDPHLVRFAQPLEPATKIKLTAHGWDLESPSSRLIHDGFVTAIRQCVERVRHEKPASPSRPRELVVHARDLWRPFSRPELRLIGLLLEVHELGEVMWDLADTSSPFRIRLDPLKVRPYASVGWFSDFARIDQSRSLQAVA